MKDFLAKAKDALMRFMAGRYGPDQLGTALIWSALIMSVLGLITRFPVFQLLAYAGLIYCLFRMFSRNTAKRAAENQAFMQWFSKVSTKVRQFIQRQKNRREYKYFRCAHCRALIRLKRGQGKVHGKCPRCQTEYDQNT